MIAMSNLEEFAQAVGRDVKRFETDYTSKAELEAKDYIEGKSDYQILKHQVEELTKQNKVLQEQLALVKPAPRRAPMGYCIEVINDRKSIWFDNGSGLSSLGDTQSGWGRSQNFNNNIDGSADFGQSIIKTSMGIATVDTWKKTGATYWGQEISVLNPIKNKDDYDWSNARFGEKGNKAQWAWEREANVIRIMYQLGIWDAKTVESLGAVRR